MNHSHHPKYEATKKWGGNEGERLSINLTPTLQKPYNFASQIIITFELHCQCLSVKETTLPFIKSRSASRPDIDIVHSHFRIIPRTQRLLHCRITPDQCLR